MATFTELRARLSPDSKDKGDQFEQICQWYLRHHPHYEAQLEDVPKYSDVRSYFDRVEEKFGLSSGPSLGHSPVDEESDKVRRNA